MVLKGFLKDLEKATGLPPLAEMAQVLRDLPDERRLRLVKGILDSAVALKGSPEELAMVMDLVRLITSSDMEHLTAVREITANLVKLMKLLPKDTLKQIPLKEITEEIKKAVAE